METQIRGLLNKRHAGTMIEEQTAKCPTDLFLWAAGTSIMISLLLKTMKRDQDALFVGQWPPTFLLLGLVGKMAKHFGRD
jgi:hypothetical protein